MLPMMSRRLVISLFAFAGPAWAQTAHPGVAVRVHAPTHLLGTLEAVYLGRSGDTLLFGNAERGPVRVPASAITQLEVSRGKSRWLGALRGAAWTGMILGALGAVIAYSPDYNPDIDGSRGNFVAAMAGGGVEIGAIVGALIPMSRWGDADPRLLVNVTQGRGAPSLGLNFSF
jgi:hypothetical protein